MKILFVGDLNIGARSFMRFRTLKNLGHIMTGISLVKVPWQPGIHTSGLYERLMSKLRLPIDENGANQALSDAARSADYDVVWIEKGNSLRPGTLRRIRRSKPNIKLINLAEDDMSAVHNRSLYYTWNLPYYDCVFTTKTCNISELKQLGARRTEFFLDSYDELTHRPHELNEEELRRLSSDATFVGTFERARAESIHHLARSGVKVTVWGNGWRDWENTHENMIIKREPLYGPRGDDFSRVFSASKICLHFLRKINRDEVTSRSMEIPASGGFMLGEWSKRHEELFEHKKEAVWFKTNNELVDYTKYYLDHEEERRAIALAGYERCKRSGYSMRDQLENIVRTIPSL